MVLHTAEDLLFPEAIKSQKLCKKRLLKLTRTVSEQVGAASLTPARLVHPHSCLLSPCDTAATPSPAPPPPPLAAPVLHTPL